jgi:hypothetical protein
MSKLNRNDILLLQAAKKSNGGGTADWKHMQAPINRMIKAGFAQWKPNHPGMITITDAGIEALSAAGVHP